MEDGEKEDRGKGPKSQCMQHSPVGWQVSQFNDNANFSNCHEQSIYMCMCTNNNLQGLTITSTPTPSPGHPHWLTLPHSHTHTLTRSSSLVHTPTPSHSHTHTLTRSSSHPHTVTPTPSHSHQVILAATGAGWGKAHVDGAIATQPALLLLTHHHSAPGRSSHIRVDRSHDYIHVHLFDHVTKHYFTGLDIDKEGRDIGWSRDQISQQINKWTVVYDRKITFG